jgi:hypothetical protein
MGRAADKGDEFPPSHGAYPKAKDRDLIITPRIAARSGQLCPLRVMCGRRLIDNSFFTLMQHWSGAVMCPAC